MFSSMVKMALIVPRTVATTTRMTSAVGWRNSARLLAAKRPDPAAWFLERLMTAIEERTAASWERLAGAEDSDTEAA